MRSYRKAYRSDDFKTVWAPRPPPGYTIANPGQNAVPGQVAKMMFNCSSMYEGRPYFAIQLYNRIANWATFTAFDVDGNPIDGDSGISFANIVFDVRFYDEHPEN